MSLNDASLNVCDLCQAPNDVDENGNVCCTKCGNIAMSVFDIMDKQNNKKEIDKYVADDYSKKDDRICKHCKKKTLIEDNEMASIVCSACGIVHADSMVFNGAEWNNYTGDRESGKDNSRVGWFDESNPYTSLGTSIKKGKFSSFKVKHENGTWVTRDLSRVNQISGACSKEKSFYEVIKKLDKLTYDNTVDQRTIDRSKILWNHIFKNGRIYRGGNRSGIIACCVLYACYENNIPMDRNKLSDKMFITTDDIVKGEPIFKSILQKTRFKYILQKTPTAKCRFSKTINLLGLPTSTNGLCNEIYNKCEEELSEISVSSATGGVIAFVVSVILKEKTPSKKDIANCVCVSVPTITNSLKIIKKTIV